MYVQIVSHIFSPHIATHCRPVGHNGRLGKTSVGAGISCSLFHVCSLQVWPRFNGISHTFYHVSSLHVSIVSMLNMAGLQHWQITSSCIHCSIHELDLQGQKTHLVGLPWSFLVAGGGITLGRSEQERSTERKSWVHSTTTSRLGSRYPRSSSNTVADSTRCNKMIC